MIAYRYVPTQRLGTIAERRREKITLGKRRFKNPVNRVKKLYRIRGRESMNDRLVFIKTRTRSPLRVINRILSEKGIIPDRITT